jgi:1-acyl-sn-glycerol-3-phosphate acyltransferase
MTMSPDDTPPADPSLAPDDALPPELAVLHGLYSDEASFGGEASVPDSGGYTSLRSPLPDSRTVTSELRELERRVRERLTPAFPLAQVRRLPLEFLWKRYRQFAMRSRSDVVDPYGRDPVLATRLSPVLDFLYDRYFRVEVEGAEHLPTRGGAILVANHAGTMPYDGLVLMRAVQRSCRRELRPLLEDAVFHFPYLGVLLNRLGAVRACPENAERLLADGVLISVFPEGEQGLSKLYKDRYKLQRFGRGGFVKLALRAGVPVIPVAIRGSEEATPTLARITWLGRSLGRSYLPITPTFPLLGPAGLLPLPSKWTIRFGAPVDLAADHGPDAANDRLEVAILADRIRSQVQTMLDDFSSRSR